MSICTLRLHQDNIDRMSFIEGCGRTAEEVKRATGCNYVLNASFYSTINPGDGCAPIKVPAFHLKADGVIRANPSWGKYEGFGWASNPSFGPVMMTDASKIESTDVDNFITGYNLLTPTFPPNATLDRRIPNFKTKRARTLMGLTDKGELVFYLCDEKTSGLTAIGSRNAMIGMKCVSAIMLDGGGSTQCDFGDSAVIRSTRPVYNFLCIWMKKREPTVGGPVFETLYRVQVGAYASKRNADSMMKKLGEHGFTDSFIQMAKINGKTIYRVQLGAFSVKANADKLMTKVKNNGFSAFISTSQRQVNH